LSFPFLILFAPKIKLKSIIMYNVYLDVKGKQLIITQQNLNFNLIMSSSDKEFAKMYCLGFIYGNKAQGFEVINKAEEFI
jgi:hypothetical protein